MMLPSPKDAYCKNDRTQFDDNLPSHTAQFYGKLARGNTYTKGSSSICLMGLFSFSMYIPSSQWLEKLFVMQK